jgi:uncharacterized membrane protein YraQ (UPF0718 family)
MARSNQRFFVTIVLISLTIVSLVVARLSPVSLHDFVRGYATFVTIFLGIFIEALPFLLLGTLASGLVEEFVNRETLGRLVPRNLLGRTLVGALMGLAFPVCECGVVPLTRRLFRKGLPLPVGVAFLLAAPIINPVVIASTFAAFGWGPIMLGRVTLALVIATVVGLIFGLAPHPLRLLRFSARPTIEGGDASVSLDGASLRPSLSIRLTQALTVAGEEFFEMGRLLVLGSLLAAGMQTVVSQPTLLAVGGGALSSVIVMLSLAAVLSVCSTVDAFLALAFTNTFTAGSILGFLVLGPMVDIKSVLLFLTVFRRRTTLYLVLLPLMMTLLIGVYLNLNLR